MHNSIKWFLLAVLGMTIALCLPTLSVRVDANPAGGVAPLLSQPSDDARRLLQQGIDRYEADRFAEAINPWQQAAQGFEHRGEVLGQALALSNLSLAYQHLGQWTEAEGAIDGALALLDQWEETNPVYLEVAAKALNTRGRLDWSQGALAEALETWEEAVSTYARAGDPSGVVLSSINQAQALQALGFSRKATETLNGIYDLLLQENDPNLKATGLQSLGKALRRLGFLRQVDPGRGALEVLQDSLEVARSANLPDEESAALLELGNTERAIANRDLALGYRQTAQEHTQAALNFYQNAALATDSRGLQLQAQLARLSLSVEAGEGSKEIERRSTIQAQLAELPPNRTTIYAQLNLAWSLTCFKQLLDKKTPLCISRDRREILQEQLADSTPAAAVSWEEIAQILATAVAQSQRIGDRLAQSYALGQLGGLYELTQQWEAAQNLTQQALLLVEDRQTQEIRYRWEWQLGRLWQQQGETKQAIAAYKSAIESLETVRSDLFAINSDVQFAFRDNVEPVYREFVELLLGLAETPLQNPDLDAALEAIDRLQRAELENFLRCDLSPTIQVEQAIDQIDPNAAFIVPILLEDRLATIVKLPQTPLQLHTQNVSRVQVEAIASQLQQNLLRPDKTEEVQQDAATLYDWIIQPVEGELESLRGRGEVATLVFMLDGVLRNIPMAVLYHDGQYLVQQYAIAIVPSRQLFDPRTRQNQLQVLTAGVSESQQVEGIEFRELPYVPQELNQIQEITESPSDVLLNQSFTDANLEQEIDSTNFPIVHIATHGEFSSEPDETFILAWGKRIKVREFDEILQISNPDGDRAIELLILSACQTAQGNRRAALGLAGVAAQARVRSTVATLWQVNDLAAADLMAQFYQGLKNRKTIADALRQAELSLLENGERRPHYWAPFVLVGNWL